MTSVTLKGHVQRPWSSKEIAYLVKYYADFPSTELAKQLNRPLSGVYGKAHGLGLLKKPEVFRAIAVEREAKKERERDERRERRSGGEAARG